MGGGLLQKVNRDTERFAFKCSSQIRSGVEVDIQKKPQDKTKTSKAGNLKLVKHHRGPFFEWDTINQHYPLYNDMPNELEIVFQDGVIIKTYEFDEIRATAELGCPTSGE
jgi:nicotinamide phosphoribosyltransferase